MLGPLASEPPALEPPVAAPPEEAPERDAVLPVPPLPPVSAGELPHAAAAKAPRSGQKNARGSRVAGKRWIMLMDRWRETRSGGHGGWEME
jgi:hypothetical protein